MRRAPAPAVLEWVDAQPADDLWITAITVAEVFYGIARLPEGVRKTALRDAAASMLAEDFAERVLAFDAQAAVGYADVVTEREAAGRPIGMADGQIAAICRSHRARLATRNLRDFEGTGVALLDPWMLA